ncbi:Septin-domain-containing protein [Polychytrium aggregatum]|uniref:Septin-domain-containing protein n=1 Tax=Polychytrium aggregatum TaxID=110093 RepID=UPI0022FEA0FD|nr:Septin-domain-containing protein [Polychytrium aggregatum]KAI9204223.1 Septin-domain-containing protein [Polychytrium aggregatum]
MPAPAVAAPSHIGIANLPNQRHKIVSRKGARFTIMVLGESGLGKTTFINTLFTTILKDYKKPEHRFAKQINNTVEIEITRAEIEEKGFNVQLTVIDTPGFGDYVNNRDCWAPIVNFIDDQHHGYMKHESRPERKNSDDLRVHACLYFIQPTGHTLKPLDIEVMKQLSTRVNLIPVIAKADTLTPSDMQAFKDRIRDCISHHGIQIFQATPHDDDDAATKAIMAASPFSVIGSETEVTYADGSVGPGRQYLWGAAEVENESHCDFKKLRNLLIRTHMHDLISSTEETHFENFRSTKLTAEGRSDDDPSARARKVMDTKMKEEEDALRKRFTEQVRLEEARFRQWEQRLIAERDRLNQDLEQQHRAVKQLEDEYEEVLALRKK